MKQAIMTAPGHIEINDVLAPVPGAGEVTEANREQTLRVFIDL